MGIKQFDYANVSQMSLYSILWVVINIFTPTVLEDYVKGCFWKISVIM